MPTNILMPALSPTMEKGNLAKWLKKEGDKVKSGDVIAEIETDKATMEVEAVDEGTLAKIVVPEGTEDVAVNAVIAVLAGEGEDVKAAASSAPAAASAPKPDARAAPAAAAPSAQPARPAPPPPKPAAPALASTVAASAPAAKPNGHGRIFSSPLARRLAKDARIDIAIVQGTGPHGRVIARDIEKAKSGHGLKAPAARPGAPQVVPHDNMRKIIAQRLSQSKQTIPHFYLTIDCDIDKLVAAREEINAAAPKDKDGKPAYKLSVNDFVIKAMALALQRVPDANVSWTETAMLKHKGSDVGVAVAIPGGLITPIIRDAQAKPVSVISAQMKDFAARARNRRLKPEEYQGGTTAVSNLGMYGIKDFTGVINPPHATILAVGAGEQRPVVRGGKIEIGTIMSVTLSCDHRAVDGALGAELLGAFRLLIENPVMMVV
jgi:pyruvate dehydrogenase E2 component (dihydrolipoamide acetyltransferase)